MGSPRPQFPEKFAFFRHDFFVGGWEKGGGGGRRTCQDRTLGILQSEISLLSTAVSNIWRLQVFPVAGYNFGSALPRS